MNSEKRILILELLKFRDLFTGSAYFTLGGRLSLLPPEGGRSSAQDDTARSPIGMHFGAISNREKRISAIMSNERVIRRDFPDFEITMLEFCKAYLPIWTMSTAMSAGETPLILCAWPSEDGFILANFCLASIERDFKML